MFSEKLLQGICVPLVDSQSLLHLKVLIQEPDDRVSAAGILHRQARELVSTIASHKRLDLWESTQFSSTYDKLGIWIFLNSWLLL